jgi:hypothetical protein
MKRILIIACLSVNIFACKTEKKDKKFDSENYEKVKETLADKEKNNPARFLTVSNKDHKNIIGQTVVKGTITNSATVCTYKDVELRLSFFSKTATKLDEVVETIFETVPPGKTVKFKTKYFAPKGTDSVAIKVVKAAGDAPGSK